MAGELKDSSDVYTNGKELFCFVVQAVYVSALALVPYTRVWVRDLLASTVAYAACGCTHLID